MQPIASREALHLLSRDFEFRASARQIDAGCQRVYHWAMEQVVGNDVYPRQLPAELSSALQEVSHGCEQLRSTCEDRDNLIIALLSRWLKTRPPNQLTPEEFYLGRALGVMDIGNMESEYDVYLASLRRSGNRDSG